MIRKLGTDGKVSTLAGNTTATQRKNATGTAAAFENLQGLAIVLVIAGLKLLLT